MGIRKDKCGRYVGRLNENETNQTRNKKYVIAGRECKKQSPIGFASFRDPFLASSREWPLVFSCKGPVRLPKPVRTGTLLSKFHD